MHRYLLILLLFFSVGASAQRSNDIFNVTAYQHTITSKEHKIVFQLQESGFYPKRIATDKDYYWYSNNSLKITQGGYSGRLLNGAYKSYYLDNNLKEQGYFENGLKTGLWSKWTKQGKLNEQANFKKGALVASFKRYSDTGDLLEFGNYRDGKKHGVWKSIVKVDSVVIIHYKNGISKEPGLGLWKKIWLKKTRVAKEKNNESKG